MKPQRLVEDPSAAKLWPLLRAIDVHVDAAAKARVWQGLLAAASPAPRKVLPGLVTLAVGALGIAIALVTIGPPVPLPDVSRPDDDTIILASGGELLITPDARIVWREADWPTCAVFRLTHGTVLVSLEKQAVPFCALVGELTVEVVGTVFRLSLAADEPEVEVLEGLVEVRRSDRLRWLGPGEDLGAFHAGTEEERSPAPASPRARARDRVGGTSSEESVPEVPRVPPLDPSEALYLRALETADWRLAVALFDEVARTESPWAELSAYRAIRLVKEHEPAALEARLELFLRAYPHGTFAPDVRALFLK